MTGKGQWTVDSGQWTVEADGTDDSGNVGVLATYHSPLTAHKGFSLLELMIAMFILIILISVAVPTYQHSVQLARETVLKENLWQMRRAIDQYHSDKGKPPQTVDDLVKDKYLFETPIDPITQKTDWDEIKSEDTSSSKAEQGLTNVKSLSDGADSDGKAYKEY